VDNAMVEVYYNMVFVSTMDAEIEPYEVYKECPYVNIPLYNAVNYAELKVEQGEWDSFLIPELTSEKVIFED
jgi:hypothetical protein